MKLSPALGVFASSLVLEGLFSLALHGIVSSTFFFFLCFPLFSSILKLSPPFRCWHTQVSYFSSMSFVLCKCSQFELARTVTNTNFRSGSFSDLLTRMSLESKCSPSESKFLHSHVCPFPCCSSLSPALSSVFPMSSCSGLKLEFLP